MCLGALLFFFGFFTGTYPLVGPMIMVAIAIGLVVAGAGVWLYYHLLRHRS